jgi:hypothetical protein
VWCVDGGPGVAQWRPGSESVGCEIRQISHPFRSFTPSSLKWVNNISFRRMLLKQE